MKVTAVFRVTNTGANIATSGTSASATIPVNSAGTKRFIRISATAAAYVRVGNGAQTAVSTDMLVQPGDSVILDVTGSIDTIAALQVSAPGVVVATPVEM